MSDLPKFVEDDHARIRRSFNDYRRTPTLDAALNACDFISIHLTIEMEVVHPAVGDDLTPGEGDALDTVDEQVNRLMEAIETLEPKDPALNVRMTALEQAFNGHVAAYQKYVVPHLAARSDQLEMGGTAFRRWQELFAARPPRTWTPMKRLANTGWGGGGRIANSGW